MSHFVGGDRVKVLDEVGRERWRLTSDLTLHIGYPGSGLAITARKGLTTDLLSDPTGILDFMDVARRAVKSSYIHDLLCENTLFTRLEADAIFLIAMEAEGVPELWRELIFAAVRTNRSRSRHNPDDLVFDVEMPPY